MIKVNDRLFMYRMHRAGFVAGLRAARSMASPKVKADAIRQWQETLVKVRYQYWTNRPNYTIGGAK